MINTDRLCPNCMNDNGGEKICSICGHDSAYENDNSFLPIKFILSERYVIGKAVSADIEGVTYIAWDSFAQTAVHIKEYLPKGISVRNPDKTVSVVSGNEFYFNEGLIDFMEIHKKLVNTELQSVIPVISVFEENGTIYATTPIVSGITLKSFLEKNGGSLRWEQARPLFLPLIDTLKGLHEIGIVHGGISPETIIVGRDGKLRLSGICIPRLRVVSNDSPAELYNGYAAPEQYGKLNSSLGEASDVYGLSATLFRVVIGIIPPSAEARIANDTLTIPAKVADELPRQVLVAIANGMQIGIQTRTIDVDSFKNELVYGETKENIKRVTPQPTKSSANGDKGKSSKANGVKYGAIAGAITFSVLLIIVLILVLTNRNPNEEDFIDNSQVESMPEINSIGDVDPDAVESVILYAVPNLVGKYYYETEDVENYERFKISIKDKEFSDKYERGMICSQTVEAGKLVENETEIQVVISLGPKEIAMPDVIGMDEMSAKLELLKAGFLYENIIVEEMYDSGKGPGVVLRQTPENKEQVNAEVLITIYINSYKGEMEAPEGENNFNGDPNGFY